MKNQKYNGWNNYATLLTALWIDNDCSSYQYRCELVEQATEEHEDDSDRENCLASSLREWIESQNLLADNANLFTDLLNSALAMVDWDEIAENFLAK